MKNSKKSSKKQPMKYWLVEFTLTSDDVLQFYVKAITQFDAYEKADGYAYWLENKTLKHKLENFKLMP